MDKTEVICISSDDENESEKKQADERSELLTVNEKSKESNILISNTETCQDSEKKGVRKPKRKISEVNGISNEKDKKVKTESNETVDEKSSKINDKESDIKTEPKLIPTTNEIIKPQLIIKEKKSISHLEQDVFPMFISLCLQKKREEDMITIVNKLKRRYEQMDPICAKSETFQNFLNTKRNDILNSENRIYHHIMEVMTEMKSKPKESSNVHAQLEQNKNNDCKSTMSSDAISSSTSDNAGNTESDVKDNEEDDDVDWEEDTMNPQTKRKLKKIEQVMKMCQQKINSLEEAEVDFDDEDNSDYIKLERYKERMVKLYAEYCKITGDNMDAGRPYLRPKHLNPTNITSVDQAITNFINAKITKRNKLKKNGRFTDDLIFPDYNDILMCVSDCNEKKQLGLDKKEQCQIAQKAFTNLGEYLQRVRRNDYWDTFSLFLENKPEDPALKNPELAQKLNENKELGEKKLTQVFSEYVKKQEEMKDLVKKDATNIENDNDEDNLESNDEDENSEEDDEDDEDEDDDDIDIDIEEENKYCEDVRIIYSSEQSEDEDKNNDSNTSSNINSIEVSIVESKGSTKNNLTRLCENKSSKDVIDTLETSRLEINSEKTNDKSKDAFVLQEKVIEPNSTKNSEVTNVQQLSIPSNNNTPNNIKELEEERNLMETQEGNDSDTKTDESKPPLLRVRSFAKPPTTWEDNKQRSQTTEDAEGKEVIDLTAEIPKTKAEAAKLALKFGNRMHPFGNKYKKVVFPGQFFKVKNITNNYVKVNARNINPNTSSNSKVNQIEKSLPVVKKVLDVSSVNTFIRLPQVSTKRNATINEKNSETKQAGVVHLVLPTKQLLQNNSVQLSTKCQKKAK